MAQENQVEKKEEQVEEVESLKRALAEEAKKAERYLANWQRAQADLENYAKRAEREKAEIVEFANRSLILNLLPILDDFDKAMDSLPAASSDRSWTEGIKIIYNKFKAVLEAQGVVEIKAKGEHFDPYFHEAVGQAKGKEGVVVEEVRKGYKFKEKVLRPSMVIVGSGETNPSEERS